MEFLKRLWAFLTGNRQFNAQVKAAGLLILDANRDAVISALRGFFGSLTLSEKIALTPSNVEIALHRVIGGANVPVLVKSTAELLVTDAITRSGFSRTRTLGVEGVNALETAVVAAIKGAKL